MPINLTPDAWTGNPQAKEISRFPLTESGVLQCWRGRSRTMPGFPETELGYHQTELGFLKTMRGFFKT
jgi:hypothetical protein